MTKLNPFILVVVDSQLNPDKYTLKQLKDNRAAAWAAATAADAYDATAACASTYAAYAAATIIYAAHTTDYWLTKYFTKTGEDKQDYIDELENTHAEH